MNKPIDQIENCLVGLAMLDEIDDSSLELSWFASQQMLYHGPRHCGSSACFGGWVAVYPHFQAQGVTRDTTVGAPELPGIVASHSVAWELFGDGDVFQQREKFNLTQKEEVRQRLLRALKGLLE